VKNKTSHLFAIHEACERAISAAAASSRQQPSPGPGESGEGRSSAKDHERDQRDRGAPAGTEVGVQPRPARRAPGKHPYSRRVVDKYPTR